MKQEFLMISGTTEGDRHQVTAAVSDAVSAAGGWIIDHTLFSNIAVTVRFSLPSLRLDDFQRRVIAARVKLDDTSLAAIQTIIEKQMPKSVDITTSLNITFIHDEPDLRREIPSVPG